MKISSFGRGLALFTVLGLLLGLTAACGEDQEDANEREGVPSSTPATSAPLSGEPYTIMQMIDENEAQGFTFPATKEVLQARIDRLNAEGGIAGRPVQVNVCNARLDPAGGEECARQAVAQGALAVVGSLVFAADSYQAILEEAGIPHIGYVPFNPSDYSTSIGYPTTAEGLTLPAAAVDHLVDERDLDKVGYWAIDLPVGRRIGDLAEDAVAAADAELGQSLLVPVGDADVSAEVQRVTSDAEGYMIFGDKTLALQILTQLANLGTDMSNVTLAAGALYADVRSELSDEQYDGIVLASPFAPEDSGAPGWRRYRADLDGSGLDAELADVSTMAAYTAGEIFAQAVDGMTDATPSALIQSLDSMTSVDTGGLLPTFDMSPANPGVPGAPRVKNPKIVYVKLEGGEFVSTGGNFVNPLESK